jgi:hypothetical protein
MQQLGHLLAGCGQVCAQPYQYLGGYTIALTDQAQQDMPGADVVVAEQACLLRRQLQHLLGSRRKRQAPRPRSLLARADDSIDLLTCRFQADAERPKGLDRYPVAVLEEAEQEVLGADSIVAAHPGLFFSEHHHNPPRPVSKPLEHTPRRPFCLPTNIGLTCWGMRGR